MLPNKICFVDIETTGTRVTYDRIIEIGILRVENNKLIDTYQTLINPGTFVSPFIENLTGISKNELDKAPAFSEVKDKIFEFLTDSVFVAHNVRFDYGFLRNELKRYDISYSSKHFCTVKLSKLLFPRFAHHNLDSVIERLNIVCEARHRALGDAKVLWEFYQKIQKKFSNEVVNKAVSRALSKPSIPLHLPISILDSLPEGPGVYVFRDELTSPLYVGKSVNIRNRVLNHFSNDSRASKEMEMCQQTKSVEAIPTAGELSALILESSLVKKLQPLFNRTLRSSMKMIVAYKKFDEDGYETIELIETPKIDPYMLDKVAGVFRSKKQAKTHLAQLVKEYNLCEKLLGLQSTNSACFAYHLGWCKGACVKKEPPIKYNMRSTLAFSKSKISSWPFKGAIVVREINALTEKEESIVLDKWCYLGSIKNEDSRILDIQNDLVFDYDLYKILKRFILKEKNQHLIQNTVPEKLAGFLN